MATGVPAVELEDAHHHEHTEGFIGTYIFSRDHKIIGIQFLFTTLIFFLLGGLLALLIRVQLAYPFQAAPVVGNWLFKETGGQIPPEFYTMLFTMHGTVMIFFVIIPLLAGAFGNFLIPLMIGARDMAFPVLNMLSYWFMWPAFAFAMTSFFVESGAGGPASGWTSYPPLSVLASAAPGSGTGQVLWLLTVLFVGIGSMMGSVNYLTTIINMRAPGMTMFRMPLTIWAMFITAILQAFALPVLTAATIMQLLDKLAGTGFFFPADLILTNVPTGQSPPVGGGQALLWQHLFWVYSHPAVYIMLLPAMGMVSDIIATFSRKPLFGYRPMVFSIAAIAGLGFVVWAHHMFQSGMNPMLGLAFMTSTMFIALPSAVKTFNWLATLWQGNLQLTTPMLFASAFVSLFIIGGLSGIFMASTPPDILIHDTYFIVAHFHYVLFGGAIFGIFAGIYYWFPKMFGRMMSEFWGKIHFVWTFVFSNLVFFPMHILGARGMPRRYAAYDQIGLFEDMHGLNVMITMCAIALVAGQITFAVNFFYSLFAGPEAGRNPWNSNSLEWVATSPAPHGNWGPVIPTVYRGPYEYSCPEVDEDFLPQNRNLEASQ